MRLWVAPLNRTVPAVYGRLHAHKEDDRYCDVLPCGTAAPPPEGVARRPHSNGGHARPNVTSCYSMAECVRGEGGRYYYQRGGGG